MSLSNEVRQLLEDVDLFRLPVIPQEVCGKLGVDYIEKPYEGFDGTLVVVGNHQLVGVSSSIKETGKKAFTCAHELGHYFHDVEVQQQFQCTRDDVGVGKGSEMERRANEFAAELLMPKDLFGPLIGRQEPSWDLIQEIASKCQASLKATAFRFTQLTHQPCWFVVVKNQKIIRSSKPDFCQQLVDRQRTISPKRAGVREWVPVTADQWLYSNHKTQRATLVQSVLPINQYGESLVLLWDRSGKLLYDSFDTEADDEFDLSSSY